MLRFTVLILALANAGYYAWAHGLMPLGQSTSSAEAEPQRLAQQLHPDALRIVPKAGAGTPAPEEAPSTSTATKSAPVAATPPAASPAPAPAPAPTAPTAVPTPALTPAATAAIAVTAAAVPALALAAAQSESKPEAKTPAKAEPSAICLQAGAFNAAQADVLRRALGSSLPADSWSLSNATLPGRWMVYMGRFPDLNTLDKKRKELQARDVPYDRPQIAALEPGLSLGRYSTEEAAERALAQLGTKGVRSARVVPERAETPAFVLRLPAVAPDARQRINATLRRALAGKTLRPC